MVRTRKLILDILKPHKPNVLEFARALAALGDDMKIKITVVEVDEKTETLIAEIESTNINYDDLANEVKKLGGAIHSIDQVVVSNERDGKSPGSLLNPSNKD